MHLSIERLAYGGDAIALAPDGRTVFVTGGCPGDLVEADIIEERPTFLRAQVQEVLQPSPYREVPPCPYFGSCGGCQWQHVAYGEQLRWKQQSIADALRRIGHIEMPVDPIVPSPEPYGYRNKIELVADAGASELTLGFSRARSKEVVPIEACMLLPHEHASLPKAITGALRFLARRAETPITRAVVRVARNGETAVDIWTAPGPFPRSLAAKTILDATGARTVTRVVVRGPSQARDVRGVEVLAGPGAWCERLGDDRYLVSAPSFFQVNTEAATRLRELVTDLAQQVMPTHVVDAYAGVGTFTIPIARITRVTAVESSRYALADLRRNLADARVDAAVAPGDVGHVLEDIRDADLVVVDPPRSGLAPQAIRAILDTGAAHVVYVSCDPSTLARDARTLVDAGLELASVRAVDLFPQTYHVESVAVFSR